MTTMLKKLLLVLLGLVLALHATAGETMTTAASGSATPAPTAAPGLPPLTLDSWWNGPSMTYDWFTLGSDMRDNGVYFQSMLTQFVQGMPTGDGNHAFEYGGKLDTFLHFEGEQAGTWKGFALDAHMEYIYGNNALTHGGVASPVNTAMLLPEAGQDAVTLSSLFATQKFCDQFTLMAGRFNTIDFTLANTYDGGRGITGFWNTSLLAPMVELKTVPPVTNGAIGKITPVKDLAITLAVFDPQDETITTGLPNFYAKGVTLMDATTLTTHFFGLPGSQSITGLYSDMKSNATGQLRELLLPQFFGQPQQKDDTWAFAWHGDQAFYQLPDNPKKTIGVFGSAGYSDGNPNPVRWSATAGIGGASPIPGREDDRFGVGYYYLGISNAVTNQKLLSTLINDEEGGEMFYTGTINKWWEVTGDVQIVEPVAAQRETAVILGASTRITF